MYAVLLALPVFADDGTFDFTYEGQTLRYQVVDQQFQICKIIPGKRISGEVLVPSKVKYGDREYTVTGVGENAFKDCWGLNFIELPKTVKVISDKAFYSCASLTDIIMPDSLVQIGSRAFYSCRTLKSISIPKSVEKIGTAPFEGCLQMNSINVAEQNKYFCSVNGVLYNKQMTELLAYPVKKEDATYNVPAGVKYIGESAFQFCDALKEIILPEGLTGFGNFAFKNCTSLSIINLPSSLASISEGAFSQCRSLASVDIPDKVRSIGNSAFMGCSALASPTLPMSLNSIGKFAFASCTSFSSVTIPAAVAEIGNGCWLDCMKIDKVEYNATTPIVAPEDIFSAEIYKNATLSMLAAPLAEAKKILPWSQFEKTSTIQPIDFNFYYENASLTYRILNSTDKTCTLLKPVNTRISGKIMIPSEVEFMGAKYIVAEIAEKAFSGCFAITEIVVSKSVIYIGAKAFSNCASLVSINLPESLFTLGDYAFESCRMLGKIDIPASVTSIGKAAFKLCLSLPGVNVNAANRFYSSFEGILFDKDKTELLLYPVNKAGSTYTIPKTVLKLGESSFQACANLTEINMSNVESTGINVFNGCSGLKSIIWSIRLDAISDNAFQSCSSLTKIIIPGSVKSIGKNAFLDCRMVTELDIPSSVEKIGDFAFASCASIPSLKISSSVKEFGRAAWLDCEKIEKVEYETLHPVAAPEDLFSFSVYDKAELYLNESAIAEAQAIVPWKSFKNILPIKRREFEYTVDGQTIKYRVLDENKKTFMTIPGGNVTGELQIPAVAKDGETEYKVTAVGEKSFFGNSSLTKVYIPETNVEIGNSAFANCTSLTIAYLAYTIVIGESAFEGCSSIGTLEIPQMVQKIGHKAWGNCNNIRKVVYIATHPISAPEDIFTENVYGLATLYVRQSALEETRATLPWSKFKKIAQDEPVEFTYEYEATTLKYRVLDSEAKTCETTSGNGRIGGKIAIPAKVAYNGVEYTVVRIGQNSFYNFSSLRGITLPNTITSIENTAFANCVSLYEINIPASVVEIGRNAFATCGLESLVIPNSVKAIDYGAFSTCFTLKTVELSNNLSSLGDLAFENCMELTSVTIPATLEKIGINPFSRCTKLEKINIDSANKNYTVSDGVLFNKDLSRLISYPGGKPNAYTVPSSVKSIDDAAFSYAEKLSAVSIPSTVSNIGKKAFNYCTSLSSIIIPDSVSVIEESTFLGCNNITTAILPKHLRNIESSAFASCNLLQNVEIPEKVETIGFMAFSGTCLEKLNIPESVTQIGDYSFSSIPTLTSVKISTSVINFGNRIWEGCYNIMDVEYMAEHPVAANKNIFDFTVYNKANLRILDSALEEINRTEPWKLFVKKDIATSSCKDEIDNDIYMSSPLRIYNLRGAFISGSLENLQPGIYIIRQGIKAKKILIEN